MSDDKASEHLSELVSTAEAKRLAKEDETLAQERREGYTQEQLIKCMDEMGVWPVAKDLEK